MLTHLHNVNLVGCQNLMTFFKKIKCQKYWTMHCTLPQLQGKKTMDAFWKISSLFWYKAASNLCYLLLYSHHTKTLALFLRFVCFHQTLWRIVQLTYPYRFTWYRHYGFSKLSEQWIVYYLCCKEKNYGHFMKTIFWISGIKLQETMFYVLLYMYYVKFLALLFFSFLWLYL